MNKMLQSLIKEMSLRFGMYSSKISPVVDLQDFFEKVQPVTTNFELIRLGGDRDGGYLIPDDLDGVRHCFSPGVSLQSYFEADLAKRNIRSYMADGSVDVPALSNPLFDFEKRYLGAMNDREVMTLEKWMNKKVASDENDMILQMDIEGSEYDVLVATPASVLNRFRIIIIEFHGLDNLLNKHGYKLINLCFDKLLGNFKVVHIHPNNGQRITRYKDFGIPPLLEFTFLRNDRINSTTRTRTFPHHLDRNNIASKDLALPECWYAYK
jgi:hypothetical protein